jgi:hypothetical protein
MLAGGAVSVVVNDMRTVKHCRRVVRTTGPG